LLRARALLDPCRAGDREDNPEDTHDDHDFDQREASPVSGLLCPLAAHGENPPFSEEEKRLGR
jgi:hypothetical protein